MSSDTSSDTANLPDPFEPMIAGTFALYVRPDGGLELVTDVEGRGVEKKTIPAALVKAFTSGKGPLAGMMHRMFGS